MSKETDHRQLLTAFSAVLKRLYTQICTVKRGVQICAVKRVQTAIKGMCNLYNKQRVISIDTLGSNDQCYL